MPRLAVKLAFVIFLLAGAVWAQSARTEVPLEDNQTITGNKTFRGTVKASNTVTGRAANGQTVASTLGSANGVYDAYACASSPAPSWCAGSDIGAWINAAAANCIATSQCIIQIPPNTAQLTISTPIVFVSHETLRCPVTSQTDSTTGSDGSAQLYYNGSGNAITMNQTGGRLEGCDILLGVSVTDGVLMGGNSQYLRDVGIRGGGSGTTLAYISGAHGGVGTGEDQHIEKSRISDFVGTGIACDNSNDTFLTDVTEYAKASNTTSVGLLIDSACTGTQITNFIGANGKNTLKVQHTHGGTFPIFLFARNFQADTTTGDCYVFDTTLGSANLDYTFLDPWAAGCGSNGIHITGGSGLRFMGGKIRTNSLNGFLIDGTGPVGIFIEHNLIEANNTSNTAGDSGILVSAHFNSLSVVGNIIQNSPDVRGNQAYAFSTSTDIDGLIFAENFCANNVTGCSNLSSVTGTKLTYYGNLALVSGVSNQQNYFTGPVDAVNYQTTVGSTCAAGNFSLTGWGTKASVGSLSGYSQTCQFTITSGAASFSAAPTFTFTFPSPFVAAAPVCTATVTAITGSGGAIIFSNTTQSSTAPVFTATTSAGGAFTPAISETYQVVVRCGP